MLQIDSGAYISRAKVLLATINTHIGRCCFKCMPFDLRISQNVLQMKMNQIV